MRPGSIVLHPSNIDLLACTIRPTKLLNSRLSSGENLTQFDWFLFHSHWVRSPLVNGSLFHRISFQMAKFRLPRCRHLSSFKHLNSNGCRRGHDLISYPSTFFLWPSFCFESPVNCRWPEMRPYTCGRLNQSRTSFQMLKPVNSFRWAVYPGLTCFRRNGVWLYSYRVISVPLASIPRSVFVEETPQASPCLFVRQVSSSRACVSRRVRF